MRRYWIDKDKIQDDQVFFTDELFHHIFEVCRMQINQHFEVLTNDAKAYLVKVIEIQKKTAKGQIIEFREIQSLKKPHLNIALSICRYPVMDSVIEKAVELGVCSILPFVSDYSFIKKQTELSENKQERWKKIIISATQQSGRGDLMVLHEPTEWKNLFAKIQNLNNQDPHIPCLFSYEGQNSAASAKLNSLEESLSSLDKLNQAQLNKQLNNIWLIIGSEGGFSFQEAQQIQSLSADKNNKLGLYPVTLGSQILRVETACMTLVAILKYKLRLF